MPISTNFYLDSRNTSKTIQEYPIKLSITKDGHTAYLSTGINVKKDQWKDRRISGRPDKARLNDFLLNFQQRARKIIMEGWESGLYIDSNATDIKNDVAAKMDKPIRKLPASALLLDAIDAFAERRKSERTKEIYRATRHKLSLLYPNAEKTPLTAIDVDWLEDLNDKLIARGNNPSTRSIDFRNLRAVLKNAHRHKLIRENPFEDFEIPKGDSPDRYLTIEQLRTLANAEVSDWEEKYRDFFLLSFYLIGINTEDLLHLEHIDNGRINYIRSKTGKSLSIKVEPEALSLLNKYKGKTYLLNILDTYSSTHNWTSRVDSALKTISQRIGIKPVTMYWARHTWATLAYGDLGVDLETISDALGHKSGKKVTMTYIRKKEYANVDATNRRMIDYLYNVKK